MAATCLHATLTKGVVVSHLLMAKTRLMPLKLPSIPKGELMGCQLAVHLAKTVCEQLDISWIQGEPHNFHPFIIKTVAEIISESDPALWHQTECSGHSNQVSQQVTCMLNHGGSENQSSCQPSSQSGRLMMCLPHVVQQLTKSSRRRCSESSCQRDLPF